MRARLATLALLALLLPACGSDDETSAGATPDPAPAATGTPTPPTATAPSAPSPPPDAPTPTATPGEEGEGGGGDEEAARIPVAVTVGSDGTITPQRVAVPAFFQLELRVRNRTGSTITARWEDSEPSGPFAVGAGKVGTRLVAGVEKGDHELAIEGLGAVTVAAGAEPGP